MYVSILLFLLGVVFAGTAYYLLFIKYKKPLYISPMPATYATQKNMSEETYTKLQEGLRKDTIAYTSIKQGNNSFIVTLQSGGTVTFSTQKDIMTQIASLQYILSHLTMEGRQFSTLDLRFKQPVIVLKP
jgi:hypothetical protein